MSAVDSWSSIFKNIEDSNNESNVTDNDIENDIHIDDENKKLEENKQLEKNSKCPNCKKTEIEEIDTIFYCYGCGLELDVTMGTEDTNASNFNEHNFNSACSIGFKVIGKKSYAYNKNMLCVGADSSKQSYNMVTKEFQVIINNCSVILPKNIIDESIQLFFNIKTVSTDIYRKDTKLGIMANCLYITCYKYKLSKTIKEISAIFNITEKIYNKGEKKIRELKEKNMIEVCDINPMEDLIERYLELLDIDKMWKFFIIDIIKKAEEKKLHILNDTKQNTRCVGVIYLLTDRLPQYKSITKEVIQEKCGVSKNTYLKYCNNVVYSYYKLFKHIFKKYSVPMKKEWNKKYVKTNEKPTKGRPRKNRVL